MSDYPYRGSGRYGPTRHRTGPWLALTLLGVLLMAGAGGFFVLVKPAAGETLAESTVKYTVSAPQQFAGLTLSSDADSQKTADELKAQLQHEGIEITETFAAVYADPTNPAKMIISVGVTGDVAEPAAELGEAFTDFDAGWTVSDIRDVDPGSRGGNAKCASATVEGQSMVVCAWADPGSLGMVFFMNGAGPTASETLFRELRAAVLTPA